MAIDYYHLSLPPTIVGLAPDVCCRLLLIMCVVVAVSTNIARDVAAFIAIPTLRHGLSPSNHCYELSPSILIENHLILTLMLVLISSIFLSSMLFPTSVVAARRPPHPLLPLVVVSTVVVAIVDVFPLQH